jgi:hypothetical protein
MVRDTGGEEERGFVVIDRRGREEEAPAPPPAEPPRTAAAPAPEAPSAPRGGGAPPLPRIDFSTLVLSLSTSALYHLGLVEDPETHQRSTPNKALARQNIDMLEVLEEKTRGNLSPDEEHLLQSLLYDLRMRFVEIG